MTSLRDLLWWVPFGRVPEIDARELHARLQGGERLALIDVRSPSEWRDGHIEGTLNVPISELAARMAELPLTEDDAVVAICLSAHRSIPAVRLLRRTSAPEVVQLGGGMRAWWAAGLPTRAEPDRS